MDARRALILLAAAVLSAGCEARTDVQSRPLIRLATTRAFSTAFLTEYVRGLTSINPRLVDLETSSAAIQALQRGDVEVGFALADVTYFAHTGELQNGPFEGRLRAIAMLPAIPLHLVVGKNSGIRTLEDLRHRAVRLGAPGGGSERVPELILNAFRPPLPVHLVTTPPVDPLVDGLEHGRFDARFLMAAVPSTQIRDALDRGARLVPVEGPAIERLFIEYPFVRRLELQAGLYPHQATPISTVGVDALIVCRSDLEEGVVYQLTRQFFEAFPRLVSLLPSLRSMNLELAPATPIPLHPGASRYYREQEILR
jgi:TRAP transporter TAXI family solute receptor